MKRKPNMQDIADAAGVSLMTVSYALRNHPCIPKSTAERVQRMAKQLGYSRNPLVSALMTQIRSQKVTRSRPVIGYLSTYSSRQTMMVNKFRRAFYEGAVERAEENGYELELVLAEGGNAQEGKRLSEVLRYRNIQGIICGISPLDNLPVPIDWNHFAGCVIGCSRDYPSLHRVDVNYRHVVESAIGELRLRGYSHIGFLCGYFENNRVEGEVLAGIAAYNQACRPKERVVAANLVRRQWTLEFMQSWVTKHKLDALIIQSSTPYLLLKESSLRIPGDLAVASIEILDPAELAGMDVFPQEIGGAAVDLVVDQLNRNIRGLPTIRRTILLDGRWIDAASAPRKK